MSVSENPSLSFAPVTLADKPTVDRYTKVYGESSCQHSFVSMFALREKYGSEICEKDGFLFTLRKALCRDGERVYLAPMGGGDRKGAYAAILADAAKHGCKAVFNTVTKGQVDFLQQSFPGRFRYTELRDYAEYVYLTESLCNMGGKKLADKRYKINRLLRECGDKLEVKQLCSDDAPELLRFEEKWLRDNAEDHDQDALQREMRAIRLQLENFDPLGLSGVGIYLEGNMIAFAYGVPLNDGCYDGLAAKADRAIPNTYKLLYREMSRLCAAPRTYFNWEEDVGVKGLRSIKTEYDPSVLMRKYLVRENGLPYDSAESEEIPVVSRIDYSINGDPPIPSDFGASEKQL